jgi:hypothetical protein
MTQADPRRSLKDYEAALKEIETTFRKFRVCEQKQQRALLLIKRFEDINVPIGDGPPRPLPNAQSTTGSPANEPLLKNGASVSGL